MRKGIALQIDVVIVDRKTLAQTKFGIQDERRQKRSRGIALTGQLFRQRFQFIGHNEETVVVDAVTVWIQAGQDGGVRR